MSAGHIRRDQARMEQCNGDAAWHKLMFQVGIDLIDGSL